MIAKINGRTFECIMPREYSFKDKSTHTLENVISLDCELVNELINKDAMIKNRFWLAKERPDESGMYTLFLDEKEIYWGTGTEINAIMKALYNLYSKTH